MGGAQPAVQGEFHAPEHVVADMPGTQLLQPAEDLAPFYIEDGYLVSSAIASLQTMSSAAAMNGSIIVASPSIVVYLAFSFILPHDTASVSLAPDSEPSYWVAVVM